MRTYNELAITLAPSDKENLFLVTAEHRVPHNFQVVRRPVIIEPEKFYAKQLLETLDTLNHEVINAIEGRRPSYQEEKIEKFSKNLFDELFKAKLRNEFSALVPNVPGLGLRIRLDLPPPLRSLPWEMMYRTDEDQPRPLGLNPAITLVRSSAAVHHCQPMGLHLPLKILVVVCSPRKYPPLNARKEISGLLNRLAGLIRDAQVQVDFIHGANTLFRMAQLMGGDQYHIVHFIGHGEERRGEVHMIMEDADQSAAEISPAELWQALGGARLPHLVILNICIGGANRMGKPFASLADVFFRSAIPAVIAHQFPIRDDSASFFASCLYESIAMGTPVDEALTYGRQILLASKDWYTPILFLNSDNGQIFGAPIGARSQADLNGLAKKAEAALSRWPEAASYAEEAFQINPHNQELQALLNQALQEEALDAYLREASFAQANEDWLGATKYYQDYLDHPTVKSRPLAERERVNQQMHASRAAAGIADPWMKWRQCIA